MIDHKIDVFTFLLCNKLYSHKNNYTGNCITFKNQSRSELSLILNDSSESLYKTPQNQSCSWSGLMFPGGPQSILLSFEAVKSSAEHSAMSSQTCFNIVCRCSFFSSFSDDICTAAIVYCLIVSAELVHVWWSLSVSKDPSVNRRSYFNCICCGTCRHITRIDKKQNARSPIKN